MTRTGDENTRINIERRVRPLRFGFVVDPSDVETVLRAFEINTFLWGGRLNPVIPLYSEAPAGWPPRSRGQQRVSPLAAAQGYLSAFEPDYLVEMREGLSRDLGFSADFVVKHKDIHYDDDHLGLTVQQVFEHEYEHTFQFVQKQPWEAAFRSFKDMELLSAATFGRYGADGTSPKRHFEQAFAPTDEVIDETTYWTALHETKLNPLRAGLFRLQSGYYMPYTLFFCDPESVHDALDFWNLRALGWLIVPLPQQWARADEVMKVVERHRGPHQGTKLLKSFASSEARWRTLTSKLKKDGDFFITRRIPPIWSPRQERNDGTARLDASCTEDEIEITASGGSLQIPVAAPPFFKGNRYGWTVHWANDLRLYNYSESDRATSFPRLHDIGRVLSRWERPTIKQSSEGLVIYARHAYEKKFVHLPGNFEVVRGWMEDRAYEVELSGAGRIGVEFVRTIGGIRYISLIKSVALIDFMNSLSHTAVETAEEPINDKRVRVGTVSRSRLIEVLRQYTDGWGRQNSAKAAEAHMRELLARSVFRVGIKLQCERCAQRNWYALDDLSETVRCERCLQTYAFPASSPTDAKWEYRPIGPFATENYAQGAYAAALAIHFLLADNVNRSVWCPGFEIKREGQKTIECDFAVFIPRRLAFDELDFAAGEAKCGGRRFQEKDYATCRSFMNAFPGAAFVFATTRTELDSDEQRAIRALVRQSAARKSKPGNPLIMLTRAELEASDAPARSWPEDLAEEYRKDYVSSQLQRLASATQRLYLR